MTDLFNEIHTQNTKIQSKGKIIFLAQTCLKARSP